VGAFLASRIVTDQICDLHDYEMMRRRSEPTMFVWHLDETLLVLGGNQSIDVVTREGRASVSVRRRRGGGGIVLLQPGDLWIDWWIPSGDPRWIGDVRRSSVQVGEWWRDALRETIDGEVMVHEGALEGELAHRVACFAGRGPGEVMVDGRKAVGLTQWRIREGCFFSTVLPSKSADAIMTLLRDVPDGLAEALDHHTLSTLGIDDTAALTAALSRFHGPWSVIEPSSVT
jgi:lipoate-protein ligase A